ncbi:hypothetical protein EST38_g8961 [Candolleomyces aberdarensis]|uniref:Uncharacterized protein n=1 Tax=Candolleomyces aberdarensis TaxID=2316362 RepID=A0A4Q2DB53_9AGAR|nr:hypothetical protein EST38_g8961 [Candolleomyces aberdarensis]
MGGSPNDITPDNQQRHETTDGESKGSETGEIMPSMEKPRTPCNLGEDESLKGFTLGDASAGHMGDLSSAVTPYIPQYSPEIDGEIEPACSGNDIANSFFNVEASGSGAEVCPFVLYDNIEQIEHVYDLSMMEDLRRMFPGGDVFQNELAGDYW